MQELKWDVKEEWSDPTYGNRAWVIVLIVGTYYLSLPSDLVLELSNCYYVPILTASIISISCLDIEGFFNSIKNKCCYFHVMEFSIRMILLKTIYIFYRWQIQSSILTIKDKN
mgnify:CR=1 FL=1